MRRIVSYRVECVYKPDDPDYEVSYEIGKSKRTVRFERGQALTDPNIEVDEGTKVLLIAEPSDGGELVGFDFIAGESVVNKAPFVVNLSGVLLFDDTPV